MIKLKQYLPGEKIDFVYDGVEVEFTGAYVSIILDYYATLGKCYYGIADDKVIGIGGVYPMWKDTGGCFLFLNKEAKKHKVSVYKLLIKMSKSLIEEYGIKFVIVECLTDNSEANSLINHLGFIKNKDIKMSVYSKKT
jgi:hypothetical protein